MKINKYILIITILITCSIIFLSRISLIKIGENIMNICYLILSLIFINQAFFMIKKRKANDE